MTRGHAVWAGAVLVLTCLLLASASSAQEPAQEKDAARERFREGRKLVQAGRYAEACAKFEESLSLERGIGTQYNLADCWERIGRSASAHELFVKAAGEARALRQNERADLAQKRADALGSKLSYLLIAVGIPAPGLDIRRDERPVSDTDWGRALAIDPGTHEVSASAPGKRPWVARVEVSSTAATITVTVPPLDDIATVPAPVKRRKTQATPAARPRSSELAPQADSGSAPTGGRLIAVLLGGAGAAALIAGMVFAIDYRSDDNEARATCPTGNDCTRADIEKHDRLVEDSRSSRNWAYLSFGTGGALLLGATAIYLASPSSSKRSSATFTAIPLVTPKGPAGAALRGSF